LYVSCQHVMLTLHILGRQRVGGSQEMGLREGRTSPEGGPLSCFYFVFVLFSVSNHSVEQTRRRR
jgi:hypothetical protein